jgi:hypothetical protein
LCEVIPNSSPGIAKWFTALRFPCQDEHDEKALENSRFISDKNSEKMDEKNVSCFC